MSISLLERYQGCLLGLACGDAVGTTVEFQPRGSFAPLTDMVGGGPFKLAPGQWTDDTSMALCLAESLLHCDGFDPRDQMNRYVNWWQWGYLSSTGECFDIGMTTQGALQRYLVTGNPYSGASHPNTAGNGSLMRLAPVVLFYYPDYQEIDRSARDSSRTTHGAPEAVECCALFANVLARTLTGEPKEALLRTADVSLSERRVIDLADGNYAQKQREDIVGTGYSVASLETALWCFQRTDSFEDAILTAANLGDDADTTAAITGQIAGAYYGAGVIPQAWLHKLHARTKIEDLSRRLHDRSSR
ncbi:MAG TPA: ADP-ribosylglycohydrolase family protein [Xanthomonadaceae bacterium]|jgi:ADP-ribosyl-[dinitrogen reductase] hydrolase|nr:ADP-ribosylglycohydrolase family protein [Xanthomonadaceae bacterium]